MELLHYTPRVDLARCEIVDRGIEVQASFSTLCALEYMKSHNIPPQIIQRVLLQPAQRRAASRVIHKN
ncbi:hypothetical protein GTP41_14660 [Pseudoduganella sp. DS3]|uniref:Uncharacterized protein n=1 Tax=Pseudoduganella guangdongensis TaxID=2692179 RepID=A0A6N9HKV0_9BURK|nr:hypothetical protein [Pseudoduganella guangdongensis]MYN03335.1 hypothetical protein [Pseudoduganella guangdongensis]